ncbi:MAG: lipopolysaccharide biosynthesis protein [Spirosoma sp.]|nr:lipopolysaccharide biosynthesis protein [Spirosoma sp.]
MILPTPPLSSDLSPNALFRRMWSRRRQVGWVIALCTGLGVMVSLVLPFEYEADAQLMPEMTGGSGDVFRRLASMANLSGIDLSETEGMDAIRPDLYPSILQSKPFRLYLIGQTVPTTSGKITVGELLLPAETWRTKLTGFWGWKKPALRPVSLTPGLPQPLTIRQKNLLDAISRRVKARFDTRSGIIAISARMPDALSAATVAQMTMDYLTRYVTNYRTGKARQDLDFYNQRLTEAKKRYQTAQRTLFDYNDQHKNLILQTATMERQQLSDELSIAQSVYIELARQHEQARLKVQQQTPVFTVLESPTVPPERISPTRTLVVGFFALFGVAMVVLWAILCQLNWFQRWQTLTGILQ